MAGHVGRTISGDRLAMASLESVWKRGMIIEPVRDNSEFLGNFVGDRFKTLIIKKTKYIIVDQFPPAGEYVPAGTAVNVTLVVKEQLPLEVFDNIPREVRDWVPDVGEVMAEMEKEPNKIVKAILGDDRVKYSELKQVDKEKVDAFIIDTFGGDGGVVDPEMREKIADSLGFIIRM